MPCNALCWPVHVRRHVQLRRWILLCSTLNPRHQTLVLQVPAKYSTLFYVGNTPVGTLGQMLLLKSPRGTWAAEEEFCLI